MSNEGKYAIIWFDKVWFNFLKALGWAALAMAISLAVGYQFYFALPLTIRIVLWRQINSQWFVLRGQMKRIGSSSESSHAIFNDIERLKLYYQFSYRNSPWFHLADSFICLEALSKVNKVEITEQKLQFNDANQICNLVCGMPEALCRRSRRKLESLCENIKKITSSPDITLHIR